jgi:arylsulfatase A-like enzyme
LIDRRTFLLTPLAFAQGATDPPNLVLIVASGWRGRATPWDGDPDLKAPNLEKFGQQSVVFSRTYCACPKPFLALAALLTSKFPHTPRTKDELLSKTKLVSSPQIEEAVARSPFSIRIQLASLGTGRGLVQTHGSRAERANYYATLAEMDSTLGTLLDALDKRKLVDNTVVCFTSDCGNQLAPFGNNDTDLPFEESVRIPLAIRSPKLKPEARDLASQVDIMPTLLTLCGMEIPEGLQGVDLFGKTPREVVYAEGKLGDPEEWRMLVRGYDKLIATPKGQATHLFNLADDPDETANLVRDPAHKLKLASLKAELQVQMRILGDGMDPSGLRKR